MFATSLFQGGDEDIALGFARHDAHTVAVAEQNIAGMNASPVDLDGDAKVEDFAARRLVLGVTAVRKGRKPQGEDAGVLREYPSSTACGCAELFGSNMNPGPLTPFLLGLEIIEGHPNGFAKTAPAGLVVSPS